VYNVIGLPGILSVFYPWPARAPIKKLLVLQKLARGSCARQQASQAISTHDDCYSSVIKYQATIVKGQLGGVSEELMLDSVLSVSLVQCDILSNIQNIVDAPLNRTLHLMTVSGDQ